MPWHLGEELSKKISVFVPGSTLHEGRNKFDLMAFLRSIPESVIRTKQNAISSVALGLQYSAPPIESLKNIFDNSTWDPPMPDAVDLFLDGAFKRASNLVKNISHDIPEVMISRNDWRLRYRQPMY